MAERAASTACAHITLSGWAGSKTMVNGLPHHNCKDRLKHYWVAAGSNSHDGRLPKTTPEGTFRGAKAVSTKNILWRTWRTPMTFKQASLTRYTSRIARRLEK